MPQIFWALGSLLVRISGSVAGRVLVALGIGVATYTGINASLNWTKSQAISAFQGLPSDVLGMLGVMKVGQAISIVFSAIVARSVINGVQSDTFKRWIIR